jgi:hypothetical protein
MIQKLEISPYLRISPRSLRQACIDVTGCRGGSPEVCRRCALVELCAPRDQEPADAAPEHVLQRIGKPLTAGGAGRDSQMRNTMLAKLASLRRV